MNCGFCGGWLNHDHAPSVIHNCYCNAAYSAPPVPAVPDRKPVRCHVFICHQRAVCIARAVFHSGHWIDYTLCAEHVAVLQAESAANPDVAMVEVRPFAAEAGPA